MWLKYLHIFFSIQLRSLTAPFLCLSERPQLAKLGHLMSS